MRVVLINYGHFPEQTEPDDVLGEFRTLTEWAGGLRAAGADVTVFQGFSRDARERRGGVDYQFVAGRFAPLRRWRVPRELHRAVVEIRPDVVHLNGLLYGLQARDLRRRLPASCVLVLQHHGATPDRGAAAALQRWGLAATDGFFFTGGATAEPWRQRGLIRPDQPVFEIMEGSSRFAVAEREVARAQTGLKGKPVFLWVGNLDANKDPLTVLTGFERALEALPEAHLYMAYRFDHLLGEVKERISNRPALRSSVRLLGTIPYEDMESIFNSADFLLQGSHKEGSGYALADALACGVVPVVTDIAPFRFITQDHLVPPNRVGALWPPDDAEALRSAILEVAQRPLEPQRRAARGHFDQHLSYEAISRRALDAYRALREARR